MQPSARIEMARIPTLPEGSVLINSEVSVISSPSPAPTDKGEYPTIIPSFANGHIRAQSRTSIRSTTPQLDRWNSRSRRSDRSSFKVPGRPGMHYQSSSVDTDLHDRNRESMTALAEFLMTKEPPPGNFMSIPDEDIQVAQDAKKRSSFRLFGWKKPKKDTTQKRLIKLPDSAVAAKTREGHRHIAISIPIPIQLASEETHQIQRPGTAPSGRKTSGERMERGPVTVLKPVVELRESNSNMSALMRSRSQDVLGGIGPSQKGESVGQEAVRNRASSSPQLPIFEQESKSPTSALRLDPLRSHRYIAVSPIIDQIRQDVQEVDPRHSGGTIYSTMTIGTTPGHSRGPSNGSTNATTTTATIIRSLQLDLPARGSSLARVPKCFSTELLPQFHLPESPQRHKAHSRGQPSIDSSMGSTPSPPTVFITGTAETARGYSTLGVLGPQIVRNMSPRSQGPPTSRLPDLPKAALARSSTAPPLNNRNFPSIANTTSPPNFPLPPLTPEKVKERSKRGSSHRMGKGPAEGIISSQPQEMNRQSRQEKVKARKQRDVEILRSNSPVPLPPVRQQPLTESVPNMNVINQGTGSTIVSRPKTPPKERRTRGRTPSPRRRSANSLSRVMLVANLPPIPIPSLPILSSSSSPILPAQPPHRSSISKPPPSSSTLSHTKPFPKTQTQTQTRTPPRSRSSSSSSLSTLLPPSPLPTQDFPRKHHSTLSLRSSLLETRRQERRMKRNVSIREKDLDERIRRIERDNRVLVGTLGGIARSFRELGERVESGGVGGGGMKGEGAGGGFIEGVGWGREARGGRDSGVFGTGEGEGDSFLGGMEGERRGELAGLDPVMRDLLGGGWSFGGARGGDGVVGVGGRVRRGGDEA